MVEDGVRSSCSEENKLVNVD